MAFLSCKLADYQRVLRSFIKPDKKFGVERHVLSCGKEVELHRHRKFEEWIVIGDGTFTVRIGDREENCCVDKDYVLVIRISKKEKHSLVAHTEVDYFVYKEEE